MCTCHSHWHDKLISCMFIMYDKSFSTESPEIRVLVLAAVCHTRTSKALLILNYMEGRWSTPARHCMNTTPKDLLTYNKGQTMWHKRSHLAATTQQIRSFFVEKISESTYISGVTMCFFFHLLRTVIHLKKIKNKKVVFNGEHNSLMQYDFTTRSPSFAQHFH